MLPPGRDSRFIERENKINEQRKELHEQRVNWIIEKTKNPPHVSSYLIATVHEELTLKQMNKYFGLKGKKEADFFWKNQRRFLEFIAFDNLYSGFEKAKPGYKYSHAWFLHKNPEYASKFENITPKGLKAYRENNWRIYNMLCERMHETSQRYSSLDAVLIRIN